MIWERKRPRTSSDVPSRLISSTSSPRTVFARAPSNHPRVRTSTSGARTSPSSFSPPAQRCGSWAVIQRTSNSQRHTAQWAARSKGCNKARAAIEYRKARGGCRWHLTRSRGHVNEVGPCKVGEACARRSSNGVVEKCIGQGVGQQRQAGDCAWCSGKQFGVEGG